MSKIKAINPKKTIPRFLRRLVVLYPYCPNLLSAYLADAALRKVILSIILSVGMILNVTMSTRNVRKYSALAGNKILSIGI
jgi:hypothetical protein